MEKQVVMHVSCTLYMICCMPGLIVTLQLYGWNGFWSAWYCYGYCDVSCLAWLLILSDHVYFAVSSSVSQLSVPLDSV